MGKEVFLIDANIFIEMLLRQERTKECVLFFDTLAERECTVALTTFAFYAVGLTLQRYKRMDLFPTFITDCRDGEFLLLATSYDDEVEVDRIRRQQNLDLDDAHQYWAAKKLGATLVSFDKDFDHTDLTRVEPREIIARLG